MVPSPPSTITNAPTDGTDIVVGSIVCTANDNNNDDKQPVAAFLNGAINNANAQVPNADGDDDSSNKKEEKHSDDAVSPTNPSAVAVNNNNQQQQQQYPLPSVEEIRAVVPKECFEKSLPCSLFYLTLDFGVIAALYTIVPTVETTFGWMGLFAWYWMLGMFLSSLFCIGHDCGHSTFSNHRWVNDLFGHVAHASIMVPYWPWQKSHRQHHQYTAHLDKDKGHPWIVEEEYTQGNWLRRNFSKIPLSGFVRWNPVYTVLGLPDGSHFWPWSRLFSNNMERLQCAISGVACLFCSYVIFTYGCQSSPWLFLKFYYVPLLFQGMWMVIITYLQHQDEHIEVYEESSWAFVRGQLQTIDRVYGFGIDYALHHITDGHVAHHFFFTRIPHYNLPKATKAIRSLLESKYPQTYKRQSTYDFLTKFLWLNLKLDCLAGKGTGLLKYRCTMTGRNVPPSPAKANSKRSMEEEVLQKKKSE